MYKTSDGQQYGHRGRARAHEASHMASMGKEGKGGGKTEAEEPKEHGGEEMPAAQVIDEHGPATHTEIHGPEKTGSDEYHVVSHHSDGHKHKSKGHDAHSAHRHSMHMITGEEPEGGEEHEPEEGEEQSHAQTQIPGM